MAQKPIIWSDRAIAELKNTLEFFTKRNGSSDYSFKILNNTERLLETLKSNEYIGRLSNNKKTRVIVMDNYLIFYEIQKEQIEILSFWDNRQNSKERVDYQK